MKWLKKIFEKPAVKSGPPEIKSGPSRGPEPQNKVSRAPIVCEGAPFDADHFCGATVLCEAYHLRGNFTLNEIADFVRETRSKHPGAHLFATLDDAAQAAYTSGHSTRFHDLDSLEGHDEAGLPESAYWVFEGKKVYDGYFPHRLSNFMKQAAEFDSYSPENQLYWIDPDQVFSTVRTRDTVSELARERESLVQIVPVDHPAQALAAFPNGYFSDDLDPFENYALARALYDRFKLSLFGAGATYLGFMAEAPLEDADAADIAEFLVSCIDAEVDKALLYAALLGQTEIYLAYGER